MNQTRPEAQCLVSLHMTFDTQRRALDCMSWLLGLKDKHTGCVSVAGLCLYAVDAEVDGSCLDVCAETDSLSWEDAVAIRDDIHAWTTFEVALYEDGVFATYDIDSGVETYLERGGMPKQASTPESLRNAIKGLLQMHGVRIYHQ